MVAGWALSMRYGPRASGSRRAPSDYANSAGMRIIFVLIFASRYTLFTHWSWPGLVQKPYWHAKPTMANHGVAGRAGNGRWDLAGRASRRGPYPPVKPSARACSSLGYLL
jgi:hypothetical protein